MTFGRRLLAAAACVPLLAALGACSEDEPEPKFAPSESPTPTETTTPEPAGMGGEVRGRGGGVRGALGGCLQRGATSGETSSVCVS